MPISKYPQLLWVWGPHPSKNCPISSNTGSNSSQTQQPMDKPPFRHSDAKSDKSGVTTAAIATTTRIRTSEVARSGAVVHHAHRPMGNWLDGARGSRLHPELMDNGWRDLQPSVRTPSRVISLRTSSKDMDMTITRLIT